jgi:hypothetical protein
MSYDKKRITTPEFIKDLIFLKYRTFKFLIFSIREKIIEFVLFYGLFYESIIVHIYQSKLKIIKILMNI